MFETLIVASLCGVPKLYVVPIDMIYQGCIPPQQTRLMQDWQPLPFCDDGNLVYYIRYQDRDNFKLGIGEGDNTCIVLEK